MFFLGALYLQGILGYDALGGRPRVPARDARDGHAVARLRGAPDHALRAADGADRRPGADRRRAAAVRARRRSTATTSPIMLAGDAAPGLGAGTCFPALMTLAMSGATQSDSGLASGLVNTTAQVGGAIGLAVLATRRRPSAPTACVADGESTAAALNARLPPGVSDRGGRAWWPRSWSPWTGALADRSERLRTRRRPKPEQAGAEPAYSEAA